MVEEQIRQESRQADDAEDRVAKKVKLETAKLDDELKTKIQKQIDYYFSDVNLVKDKFMQQQLEKNNNTVELSVLATFARLAQLTKDVDVMIASLKDFESDFMELDEDKKLIRRKKALPDKEEYQKQLDLRTVHISGFPDTIKFENLSNFCTKFGEVESLSMRQHYKTKQFKGCIHVTFKSDADAKKVMDEEALMFKDRELRRESMEQYHKRKEDIKKDRMEKRKNKGKNHQKEDGDESETVEKPAPVAAEEDKAEEVEAQV